MDQIATRGPESDYGISIAGMPMGLAIMFNDKLYERCKQIAGVMARAEGFTPPHLIGKSEACFAVVTRSITWKLDPQAVAQATYQTPGGRIGYEGKLVQAILENSGKLEGPVDYELIGNWDKINGNFEIKRSEKGKDYAVPKWTRQDAKAGGCGVIVSAQVRGEKERRTLKFMLETCFPLNSTLWAIRPDQQIKYTGCRAFANTVAPGIMMGEPFDVDPTAGTMIDVTPKARPVRDDFADKPQSEATDQSTEQVDPETGEVSEAEPPAEIGPPDAMELGVEARVAGKSMFSFPEQWNADGRGDLIDAFKEGWREKDAEIGPAAKKVSE